MDEATVRKLFYNTSIGFLQEQDFENKTNECVYKKHADDDEPDNSKNGKILKYSKLNPDKIYMTMVFANWCGPCKIAKPHYRSLSQLLDKHNIKDVRLTAIDASDDSSLADSICVRGYPTFLIWKNGEKKKYTGPRNSHSFVKALAEYSHEIKEKLDTLVKDATVNDALNE
jgi:thiol-disulfide isomerase/thioredoxin